jgi:hypothetical protein
MIYRTISAGEIIAKIYRDLGNTIQIADWEQDALEWIGEALEHIGAGVQLEKKQDSLTISSFRALLPTDLVQLIDVFYSASVTQTTETAYTSEITIAGTNGDLVIGINGTDYSETFSSDLTTTAENFITSHATALAAAGFTATSADEVITLVCLDLDDTITLTDSSTGDMSYTESATAAILTVGSAQKYALNRSSGTLHGGIATTIRDDEPEFTGESYVLNPDYIHTSFETGYLFITYMGLPVDANGIPLVPDDMSYREAFFWYILKMLMMRGWKHPTGMDWTFANSQWQRYCTQARNAANMPDIGQYDQFLKSWVKLVPTPMKRESFFEEHDLRNPNWTYGNSDYSV